MTDWTKDELETAYPEGSSIPFSDGVERELSGADWSMWIAANIGMPKTPEAE